MPDDVAPSQQAPQPVVADNSAAPEPPAIPLEWHPTDPPPVPPAASDTEQRLRALLRHYAPTSVDIEAESQWVMQAADGYQYRPPLRPEQAPAPRAQAAAQPAALPTAPQLPTAEQIRKMTDREFEQWDQAYFRPIEAANARRGHTDPAPRTAYL